MSTTTTATERRKHPRFRAQWPVSFAGGEVAGEGTVIDVSEGGCSILSSKVVPSGVVLDLHVLLQAHGSAPSIRVPVAEVRWSSGRLLGICFRSLDREARTRLLAAIKDLAASAVAKPLSAA